MNIECDKCGTKQKSDDYFLRFLPEGLSRPIYVCEDCEKELGGKLTTRIWVIDTFVPKMKDE